MSARDTSIGLRVPVAAGIERGERLTFTFDGEPIVAFRGESCCCGAACRRPADFAVDRRGRGAARGLLRYGRLL